MRDVVVVGGGPVGGQAARLFAEAGFDVLLVEEHGTVGEPVQCAGLFTPRIFDHVKVPLDRVHLNDIRGARIWSPRGHAIELDGGKTMAVAVDRADFDRACVEAAAKAGAEVRLRTKATAATRNGAMRVRLSGPGGEEEVETRLLVGADGVQSAVAKWFRLPRAKEILPCHGAQVDGVDLDPRNVEMFVGSEQAPGFFSWMIPTNPEGTSGKVEVGTGFNAPRPAKHYYDRMYEDPLSARFLRPDARTCFSITGCIPLGPLATATAERVALVGDAAAQTKPTSGGGVYTGVKCAEQLAEVATLALEEDDLSAARLAEYDRAWMDDLGRELKVGWRLRKAFMRLSDEQIEKLFDVLDDREVLETINVLGDIDYPSRLAKALVKKAPQLFQFSGPAIKSLFD